MGGGSCDKKLNVKVTILSTSRVGEEGEVNSMLPVHTARVHPDFLSIWQLLYEYFLPLPQWDAKPIAGLTPALNLQAASKTPCPRI